MDQAQQHALAGGLLVISYVVAAHLGSARYEELWGFLPWEGHGCTRRAYGLSIAAAALGFIVLIARMRGEVRGCSGQLFAAFAAVSALWLPLALLAVRCKARPPWALLVRAQLLVAAVLAVLWMLEVARLSDALALLGAFLLAGNSLWMDALSWPCFLSG